MKRRAAFVLALLALSVAALAATYRGNTNSRVYHQESCRYYTCKHCTVTFSSPAEAARKGYRPCGVCRPGGGTEADDTAAEAAFSGNTSSHKFHRASCRYASCSNCTAKFKTRQEAIDAGYSPGGCCHP